MVYKFSVTDTFDVVKYYEDDQEFCECFHKFYDAKRYALEKLDKKREKLVQLRANQLYK